MYRAFMCFGNTAAAIVYQQSYLVPKLVQCKLLGEDHEARYLAIFVAQVSC